MFGSHVLDVVTSLVFAYLLLSIICTAVNEMIAAVFALRARNPAAGIANLLRDRRVEGLAELFYNHPLVKSLYRGARKPSYVPPHTFALAFLDGIAPAKGDSALSLAEITAAVNNLSDDSELKRVLLILLQQAGGDVAKLQTNIETWFNDAMARVSGWYKRKSQIITVILAILITVVTDADTIQIVQRLSTDSAVRAAVVAEAQEFIKKHFETSPSQPVGGSETNSPQTSSVAGGGPASVQPQQATLLGPKETMTATLGKLQQRGFPLGWQAIPQREEGANKIIGLLLTIFAVSLGAPFWFDILNRVSKIRSTGLAPDRTAKEEKKEKPA